MGLEVKNPLRAQSKYGLLDPVQKQENFLLEGHRSEKDVFFWVQNIKVPFAIGHPTLHIKPNLYCAGGFRGYRSSNRIELSQFIQELL